MAQAPTALANQDRTSNEATASSPLRAATLDLVPYYFREFPGRPGLLHESAIAILNKAGLEAEFTPMPPKKLIKSINEGDSDIAVYGDLALQRNNPNFIPLGMIFTNVANSFVTKEDPHSETYSTFLRGKTVIVPTLTVLDNIPGSIEGINFIQVRDYAVAMRMLAGNRADAVMGLEPALRYFRGQTIPFQSVHYMEIFTSNVRQFRSLNSQQPQEKWQQLAAATNDLYEDGTFYRISEKYLPGWQSPTSHLSDQLSQ